MSTCQYAGSTNPRMVIDEDGEQTPCPYDHCRVCAYRHVNGLNTCPDCTGDARSNLRDIKRMSATLPSERTRRGIGSEAASLAGPVANVEARQHVEASYLAGRLPEGWIDAAHGRRCPLLTNEACVGCAGGELHPLTVLGTWEMLWRAELEHDETARITVPSAVAYLDMQLTYMAGYPHVPFEDFATDVTRCVNHLRAVLHDSNQGDQANVSCFDCAGRLERRLTTRGFEDWWTCSRCHRRYTDPEYHLAVRARIEEQATENTQEAS